MLCLSGFELYSRWVPLFIEPPRTPFLQANLDQFLSELPLLPLAATSV